MNTNDYLNEILDSQTLAEGSTELTRLRERRAEVDKLLKAAFGAGVSLRYGGSKAKGTMIKESYDLDIVCYFPRDDSDAGGTIAAIFENVHDELAKKFVASKKTSAIRLSSSDYREDCHIDVVPGRFVDDTKSDVFLHQNGGSKARLKTNLDTHVEHVKGSGVVPAVRLMKLWRVRNHLSIRNFGLELMTIELAKAKKSSDLETQLSHIWTTLRDDVDSVTVQDPANPYGNDLSELLSSSIRSELSAVAARTLENIRLFGWDHVFGKVGKADRATIVASAVNASGGGRPWSRQ